MSKEKQLAAHHLSCVRQQKPLFADISFYLHASEILLVKGPNGSGKSSLLRLLTGLALPATGHITWQGKSIQETQSAYGENLHYLGHTNGVKLGLTVLENLQLTLCLSSSSSALNMKDLLECLQLSAYQHHQAKYLSAGQKRRLALAKLFLVPKPLWILDEPLTALDALTQQFFLSQLKQHAQNGGISIITSHQAMDLNNIQVLRLGEC